MNHIYRYLFPFHMVNLFILYSCNQCVVFENEEEELVDTAWFMNDDEYWEHNLLYAKQEVELLKLKESRDSSSLRKLAQEHIRLAELLGYEHQCDTLYVVN